MFDFSKAFDDVGHAVSIDKLRQLRAGGLFAYNWLSNFLIGRTMKVAVSGVRSSSGLVRSGVPQLSILDPLLLLIHINELRSYVWSKCKFLADDLVIYEDTPWLCHFSSLQCKLMSERHLGLVHRVSHSWGLNFSTNKYVVLWCCRDLC